MRKQMLTGCLFVCVLLTRAAAQNSTDVRAGSAQPAAATSGTGISSEAIAEARRLMNSALDDGTMAGGAHMVVQHGKVIHFSAVGVRDIETGRPFQKDTILRFYSMTKAITSVAAMQLFEQGKFKLQDPIAKYIPEFEQTRVLVRENGETKTIPADSPITVLDAFRHTTGYSYGEGNPNPIRYYQAEGMRYRGPGSMYPPDLTIEEVSLALARIPALHHPGKKFTYGYSTDLLGRLVEVWTGQTLDEYLSEAIFQPLEMPDTAFFVPKDKRARFASCHTLRDGRLGIIDKFTTSEFNDGFSFLSGGGGLVSTIQDYANFCQMLVSEGNFNGKQILKPETVQLMFTDQLNGIAGGFQFGLGFAIEDVQLGSGDDQRTVKQYQWGGYASTDFRLVPEEGLFQIVVRQRVPSDHSLAGRLFPVIYKGMEPPGQ